MNRLRDLPSDGAASGPGLELLRNTPPTEATPEMRRRVWASLQARRAHAARGRRRIIGIPAFAAGVVIVSLMGTAGAGIARRWLGPALGVSLAPRGGGGGG